MGAMVRLLLGSLIAICLCGQEPYVFGFLRVHPERKAIPQEEIMKIQEGHMTHLTKMANDGLLVGAGPLVDSPDLRGVLIFHGASVEQAVAAASQDPAAQNKRLYADLAEWTGPAGIGKKVMADLKAKPDVKIAMTRRVLLVYWKGAAMPADLNSPSAKKIVDGHVNFIRKMQATGKVLAAGPLKDSKDFAAVVVFSDAEPAPWLKLAQEEDPFVLEGWVRPQAFQWFVAEDTFAKP